MDVDNVNPEIDEWHSFFVAAVVYGSHNARDGANTVVPKKTIDGRRGTYGKQHGYRWSGKRCTLTDDINYKISW